MMRRTFDDDVPLPPRGRAPVSEPVKAIHHCRWCGVETSYDTMAKLGARCVRCFDAYCRSAPKPPHVPPEAVPPGTPEGIKWAYRLRYRHQQGERLTKAQIDSYREVLARYEMSETAE